ncbi:MAG: GIY-YIG nuclease family protein [Candidatus Aenigmatarchaeota archaeon]|nr:MAG: GIY-YIG nuclease family protein [Candidatus Aenigmarchaeota archaeon]
MMKGTYVLFLESKKDQDIVIGKLGECRLKGGLYAYIGSAMGSSVNLENRIGRHKRMAETKEGNKQWHIDYVTTSTGVVVTGTLKVVGKAMECKLAGMMKSSGGRVVLKGFGSSDCGCETHFFRITPEVAEAFLKAIPDAL